MHCCNPADSGKRAERPHSVGCWGDRGSGLWITALFCVDDGNHTDFGNHGGVNANSPFSHASKVVIGGHAIGAPDVQIDRHCFPPMQQTGSGRREGGSSGSCKTLHRFSRTSCPDRNGIIVMPWATIGNHVVTGEGRVFTRDGRVTGLPVACRARLSAKNPGKTGSGCFPARKLPDETAISAGLP